VPLSTDGVPTPTVRQWSALHTGTNEVPLSIDRVPHPQSASDRPYTRAQMGPMVHWDLGLHHSSVHGHKEIANLTLVPIITNGGYQLLQWKKNFIHPDANRLCWYKNSRETYAITGKGSVCFRFFGPRFSENQDSEISQLSGESAIWISWVFGNPDYF